MNEMTTLTELIIEGYKSGYHQDDKLIISAFLIEDEFRRPTNTDPVLLEEIEHISVLVKWMFRLHDVDPDNLPDLTRPTS
jgi:hypothetical protein